MKGIRRRVTVGFLSIVGLLFTSGMISFFELNHLTNTTEQILLDNKQNITFARDMLDAAHQHNLALVNSVIFHDKDYDSLCYASINHLENTILTAQMESKDKTLLDSLEYITTELRLFTERTMFADGISNDSLGRIWYDDEYEVVYSRLTTAVKDYMTSAQSSLAPHAEQVKRDAYRAVTPVLIALLVMIAIVLMFFFFMTIYGVNPIVNMNKSLGEYITYKIPFVVKDDCKDEISELKEKIENLILISKQTKSNK